jgi:hypothetical protein
MLAVKLSSASEGRTPNPLTRVFTRGPHWEQSPQTPDVAGALALAMTRASPHFSTLCRPWRQRKVINLLLVFVRVARNFTALYALTANRIQTS